MAESQLGATLLNISPDEVFSSRSVPEVIELHKKIQYEIERKREDLRAMVGERYRELIYAADTIGEMKTTTDQSLQHLGATVTLCRNLHDTHLIGFRIPERNSIERSESKIRAHSVAVQVKLLMDIPDQVWSCIEREDFLTATQLYLLARHINTGLQMQANIRHSQAIIAPLKSVIEQQWNMAHNLHKILEGASRKKLEQVDLKEEVAISCLLSLHLLDPQSQLLSLLSALISLHSEGGLARSLAARAGGDADVRAVTARIVDSARLIVKTIELVQRCFVAGDGGSVLRRLNELYDERAPPLVQLVRSQDKSTLALLPNVISTYRLSSKTSIEPLSVEDVSRTVTAWIDSVGSSVREKVRVLLNNVASAKMLNRIREEALKIETPENWEEICSSLSMPNIDIWTRYYQPLLTARVKEIVDTKWQIILGTYKTQMLEDLIRVSSEKCTEREADLNWFVWKDLIGETVIESTDQVVEVMNSLMKGMWLQDRGFSPTLERTCLHMDRELGKLLADLSHYLYDRRAAEAYLVADDGRGDRVEIEAYVREVAVRHIESILNYIKDDIFNNNSLQSTELQRQTTSIYTARFIQSLIHLMPNLRACYVPKQYLDYDLKVDEGVKKWNDTCAVLKENCLYCWGRWVDIAMARVELLRDGLPKVFTVESNIEYLLMQWDVIKIEEKDDEGNPVESVIKIPSCPSLKLQEFLYQTSRILDETVPHTLPREVHSSFIEKVAAVSLAHYDSAIRENETDINQKCALQLMMDVRHIQLLMVGRENKEGMERAHEICELLRKIIDPFDYDVFYPYIQTNVKRSVQKIQTLLGELSAGEQLPPSPAASAPAADRSPALLAAAPHSADWFSVLAVSGPAAERTRKKASANMSSSVPAHGVSAKSAASDITELMSSSLSGAKSGAAAFFGDWFSSS